MLMMNDLGSMAAGMLHPFDPMPCGGGGGGFGYEQHPPKPRFVFKMPRVVPDQKTKFETDELFRRLSRESDVRYTGYRDRPHEERQSRFQIGCREGHVDIAFVSTGTNLQLMFTANMPIASYHHQPVNGFCDFQKERGMVHILSHFIMNGVCVRWKGRIDLDKLDGTGCLEFDEERAMIENRMLQEQIERYNDRIRDYQDKSSRAYHRHQERGIDDSGSDAKRRSTNNYNN